MYFVCYTVLFTEKKDKTMILIKAPHIFDVSILKPQILKILLKLNSNIVTCGNLQMIEWLFD
jgi:hypothetical protein